MRRTPADVVVVLVAVLVATLGAVAQPSPVRAAGEVTVVASGRGPSNPLGADDFSVAVTDDGAGHLTGTARMSQNTHSTIGTGVTCLKVDGNAITVGVERVPPGGGEIPTYFTIFLTGNG